VPDLLFFAAVRWKHYTETMNDWQHKPFIMVTDLVVEIVSANDRFTDVQKKVNHYLSDGVRLIWVIDPDTQTTNLYYGDHLITLSGTDTLTGGDVLPSFSIALADLFKTE